MNGFLLVLLVLLAAVAVVLLWRLVLTAAGIALVQWAVVSNADSALVQLLTFALPALLAAFVLVRLMPARPIDPTAYGHRPVAEVQGGAR
jgi:hypothetical protein